MKNNTFIYSLDEMKETFEISIAKIEQLAQKGFTAIEFKEGEYQISINYDLSKQEGKVLYSVVHPY